MGKPVVHLVNPLESTAGGSEWRTIELYRLLCKGCDVRIWTARRAHPQFAAEVPAGAIHLIDEAQGRIPRGGCLVVIGAYYTLGSWVIASKPERAVLIYNVSQPGRLVTVRDQLLRAAPRVDVVYASHWLQREGGVPGVVQVSPIDLSRFTPRAQAVAAPGRFTVGRMSRDARTKHHPPDTQLYSELVKQGCDVRIMGGTVLRELLRSDPGVELLPANAVPAEEFLHGLDCFYYRTSNGFVETFGRVVMEAMACGVPVVAHRRGGYAEWITDGVDGFLIANRREAFARIGQLKHDPALAAAMGRAARQKMERIYSPAQLEAVVAFYRDGA